MLPVIKTEISELHNFTEIRFGPTDGDLLVQRCLLCWGYEFWCFLIMVLRLFTWFYKLPLGRALIRTAPPIYSAISWLRYISTFALNFSCAWGGNVRISFWLLFKTKGKYLWLPTTSFISYIVSILDGIMIPIIVFW